MKLKLFVSFFCLTFFLQVAISQVKNEEDILKTFHSISSNEILSFADSLTDAKYKGRLSGSPEFLNAARWCASKLKEWGLKPANKEGWFQYFPNAYSEVFTAGKVTYTNGDGENTELRFIDDYYPGSNSDSGAVTGNLVYCGYGITAPELNYDDYKNIDVKGKIVLLERGIPYSKNDTTLAKWTPYAYHRYKFNNAAKHGAAGLLYISKVANPNTSHTDGLIYAHIGNEVAERFFNDAEKNYASVKKALAKMQTPSFEFPENQWVTISAETKNHPDGQACNVVGLIKGVDPDLKKEVIIVGAHLDGQGYLGKLFPGALDNASGVADVLGAAKALANSEIKPKRSVLFVLFGGEECGLYGSAYYTKNPLFPLDKTVFMINLDMVGNGTGFYLEAAKSYPEIFSHFQSANEKYIQRKMDASEWKKNYGRPRSDASNFENAGIKTLSLWTSGSVLPVYYHHPLDKTDVLTPEIMEDAAKLIYISVLSIANDETIRLSVR